MAKRKISKPRSGPAKRRKAVHVDALPWNTVELPEMFDDAEGFYGLEEVKGVEVVRDGETVQFVAAVDKLKSDSDDFEGFDDLPEDAPEVQEAVQPTEDDGDDEDVARESKGTDTTSSEEEDEEDSELESDVFTKAGELEGEMEDMEEIDMSGWASLDLSPKMLSSISRLKFSKPTLIQSRAVPEIMKGDDVIGKAATGSGKTLAFGIPIVEKWLSRPAAKQKKESQKPKPHPIALVLSPTRELSHQITKHLKELCAGLTKAPRVCSVTGGLSIHKQQRQLEKADIVIGTPGRLWEVMSSSNTFLNAFKEIDFLVVDEADRLLTDGHFKEAEEIFKALDRRETDEEEDGEEDDSEEDATQTRQTLVFSATFNKKLQQKLAGKGQYDLMDEKQSMEYLLKKLNFREKPKFIDVNPVSQMAEGLKEGLIECGAMEKDLYLYATLLFQPTRRTLVFTNSIGSVRRITPLLNNLQLPAYPLHSEMAQKARLRSIERFTAPKEGKATASAILVATDVAARGLDIPGIDLVIHYHVPRAADTYVHRSGRTARAESSGISIMLCAPEEVVPTRRLVAKVHAAAQPTANQGKKGGKLNDGSYFIRTVDLDRRIVSRLKERVVLAKQIADTSLAKERGHKGGNWMKEAAETLGVEYDSEEIENAGKWGGRGSGRKKKEKEAKEMTKAEIGALRARLRELLSKRINTGVSEKYLTGVDVDKLLKGEKGEFFGSAPGLGLDN